MEPSGLIVDVQMYPDGSPPPGSSGSSSDALSGVSAAQTHPAGEVYTWAAQIICGWWEHTVPEQVMW